MKKLIYLIPLLLLFTMCDTKEPDNGQEKNKTSFVFIQTVDNKFENCKAAYLNEDNVFVEIAYLGEMELNTVTDEVFIEDENISEIYFFMNYRGVRRFRQAFVLQKGMKNIFNLTEGMGGYTVDPTNPKEYPVEEDIQP